MIVRVGFLVVASVAAVSVSHFRFGSSTQRKQTNAIKTKPSEDVHSSSQQDQIERKEEEKFADADISMENKQKEEDGIGQYMGNSQTELLQNLVKEIEQRKLTLEGKLLELYGLKEQQSSLAQLQWQLNSKMKEIDTLKIIIKSLQAEKNELHEEIKQNQMAEKQLDTAKNKIKVMQGKMRINAKTMKGQLTMVDDRVSGFQKEEIYAKDAIVDKKLKAVRDVEFEVMDMKRRNRELQLEKRELTVKLVAAQVRLTQLSNMTESKTVAKVEEEILGLRKANEEVSKQIEKMQQKRFGMVEELLYQRWINACLRFERKNQKHRLGKKLTEESNHEKPNRLTSSLSFDSVSSPRSSSNESNEIESTTFGSSSSSQTSISKESNLIPKIKKWGRRRKDDSSESPFSSKSLGRTSLIRRFSMSMVPSNASKQRKEGNRETIADCRTNEVKDTIESPTTPSFSRRRRVSFSDSVKTISSTVHYIQVSDEEEPESPAAKLNVEKAADRSIDANGKFINEERIEAKLFSGVKVAQAEELQSRMPIEPVKDTKTETQTVHFSAVFFFFVFVLLAYCILHTARVYKA